MGKTDDADGYTKAALLAVWQSPDLAPQDRRRVIEAIKAELAEVAGGGHGAVAAESKDPNVIMKSRAMSLLEAHRQPPLTYQEIIA